MEKLKAIIADDEERAINLLEKLLIETEQVEILGKTSESLKVECLTAKYKPDVLFLDIQMPDIDGIKILENIREYNTDLRVVYVSAYNKYGIEALKLKAFDYLIKPVDRKELRYVIEKLIAEKKNQNENRDSDKIKLPVKDGIIYIKFSEILYLKAEGNYTNIFLISGEEYLSSYNMGRLTERFCLTGFERINRNLMANSDYIHKINKLSKTCVLKRNGIEVELPISGTFIQNIKRL